MAKKNQPLSEKGLKPEQLALLESLRHDPQCHVAYKAYSEARANLRKIQGACRKCSVRGEILNHAAKAVK